MKFVRFRPEIGDKSILVPLANIIEIEVRDDNTASIRYKVNYAICEICAVKPETIEYIEL